MCVRFKYFIFERERERERKRYEYRIGLAEREGEACRGGRLTFIFPFKASKTLRISISLI